MIINIDGFVTPCCFYTNYQNWGGVLGNLNDQSIEEIWNGEAYRALRHDIQFNNKPGFPCYQCMAYKMLKRKYPVYIRHQEFDKDTLSGQNYLLNVEEFQSGTLELQSKPTIITYVGAVNCNLKCTFCNQYTQHLERLNQAKKSSEEIIALIPYLLNLAWQGGECFLDEEFKRFFYGFKRDLNPNLHLNIVTNGMLADKKVFDTLVGNFSRYSIAFSIDSFEKNKYELLRSGSQYNRVFSNLKLFIEEQKNNRNHAASVSIQSCVMKSNILQLADNIKFALDNKISFGISPVLVWPPNEALNVFNDHEIETKGWQEVIQQAQDILVAHSAKNPEDIKEGLFGLDGTLKEVSRIYQINKQLYERPLKIKVKVNSAVRIAFRSSFEINNQQHIEGNCYTAFINQKIRSINEQINVFEDDQQLAGPFTSNHSCIARSGAGRFSFGSYNNKTILYYSASDNSNPLVNNRRYTARFKIADAHDERMRVREPYVIVSGRESFMNLKGYSRITGPGMYSIILPEGTDINKISVYGLIDVLDTRSLIPAEQIWVENNELLIDMYWTSLIADPDTCDDSTTAGVYDVCFYGDFIFPGHIFTQIFEVAKLNHRGAFEKALHNIEQLIAMYPNIQDIFNLYISTIIQSGNLDKAVIVLNKALDLLKDNLSLMQFLSEVYIKKKDYKNAFQSIKRILDIDPNNAGAHETLKYLKDEIEKSRDELK
jgi:MoaA/NifB/PqqE/SkfB family radical SAM enzyme